MKVYLVERKDGYCLKVFSDKMSALKWAEKRGILMQDKPYTVSTMEVCDSKNNQD